MKELTSSPFFGVLISLLAYFAALRLNRKTRSVLANPLLVSQVLIIIFLFLFDIEYEDYIIGGQYISFFLVPATIVLAIPLFKQFKLFKKHAIPIIGGIFVGAVSGVVSVILLAKWLKLDDVLMKSLIPKSITTPIGMELVQQIGGNLNVTVSIIVITGIIGSIIVPYVCKFFKINDKVAIGIAYGTSSHAVGSAQAIEQGEVEGAMSSLSIGVAGVITVLITPIIMHLLESISFFN